ncbi:branched-chain amino acid ABC transporter permease [Rhizobiaceae bacterium BDR2-2]|uniref:Branched-chain amino acid ABC transporter permease n=1 Tax=Ectorhizobium quercum TaxID=2965071 RepID=A0AAE3MY00_9HYPH|nr:branched-chain amino acid ABC transporter permease [Ectorhizobium quercum]MCX8997093.1 branched-chain amino acid ABC transporter permease [Ectorhizobium quercum]
MDLFTLAYALVNGILIGGIYGGIALGLSLIFGVMRVINFAHGSFLMLAMYVAYMLWAVFGLHPYVSVIGSVPILFCIGFAVQQVIISPLFKRERAGVVEPTSALLLTAGVFLVIDNLVLMVFGPDVRSVNVDITYESIFLGDVPVNLARLIAFVAAVVVAAGLAWWLKHSEMGRSIRATAQNRDAAALSGINVPLVYNVTFGIGCAVLGLFGALLLPFFSLTPTIGLSFGIKSFLVVVLGGIGSIPGCILGGIVLGIFESVASQFVTATSAAIFSFGLFIAILLFRPTGLLGR